MDKLIEMNAMRRLPKLRELRGTLNLLATGAALGEETLILSIVEGLREVIPLSEFDVSTDGKIIRITGINGAEGISCSMMPFFAWRAPLPVGRRLEMILKSIGVKVQDLLTKAHGKPWPAIGAEPHVLITSDHAIVWWGGPAESEALARLGPISWTDPGSRTRE